MTLAEFRALASKATPGAWWRRISQSGICAYLYADGHLLADLHSYTEGPGPDRAQRDANAAWIAAASPTAILALIERLERAEAFIAKPAKHRFWRPGEADCPRDIKAPNGELHTLRCKVCGEDDPRDQICRATYFDAPAGEGEG